MKTVKKIVLFLSFAMLVSGFCLSSAGGIHAASDGIPVQIILTEAEKAFIEAHPVIHLGVDPTFVPYEFIDSDGVYKGIAADYIVLISQKLGLEMVVAGGLTWTEAYEKAVNKELDVLPCVSMTKERQQYFLYTDAYFSFQRAIFVKKDNSTIESFDDLIGQSVAVQENSSHHGFLSKDTSIKLNLYPTVQEALTAVSDGKEAAFVGNFATSSYLSKSLGITNLKYMTIDSRETQSLYFAVRNDWPELVSILNKALAGVTEEEKIAIRNKWIGIEESPDYSRIIQIAQMAGAAIAVILVVSVFWIIRLRKEVAKRKKAQEELQIAKDEAERANQTKSLFLARMSHEIRTPLHAIMGMSYLFRKTDISPTQAIYLEKLIQSSKNMLSIINDILDFSKIEAGKIDIERVSFDLEKVLQRVIAIASVKVEEQGIELLLDKEPNMPQFFFGDPARIEQILLNLVSNAVKFTKKGSVRLSVRVLEKNDAKQTLEFCVRDTGIGMSQEQQGKLFVPFEQGDSSISRRFGGTGLGLSIVKNLVELMGGEIEVSSVLNEGSSFCIRLPLEEDTFPETTDIFGVRFPEKQAADTFGAPVSIYPYHVLVVEDNKTNQFIAQSILEHAGFKVSKADDGSEGYQFFKAHREELDLILMDIHMPGMDGYTASDLIREIDPDVPIVAMTADAITGAGEASKSHGMDRYVSKPFEPDELIETLLDVLKSKNRARPPVPPETDTADGENVLDAADGIRRIGGDRAVYRLILQEYQRENKNVSDALNEKIKHEDYTGAVQLVHKIKGSSGNIGAKSLYAAASDLQAALTSGDKEAILRKYSGFTALFDRLMLEIQAFEEQEA